MWNNDKVIAPSKNVVIECNQRLSKSLLWRFQRNFFDRQGVEAWNQGTVPHYITSNPFIANAYAKVIFGFLRDCHAQGLNTDQPVYIMELGAGSGRFAYHFLKKFFEFFHRSPLNHISVKYVMTDFTDRNLAFWRSHPFLYPFVRSGVLDFARFDMERDRQLTLDYGSYILSAATLKNPLIVLANYVFDSIPSDAFSVRNGQLYESLVTLIPPQPVSDLNDPTLINQVEINFEDYPITSNYYDNPNFNKILENYRQRLQDTTILFPRVGLKCIDNLRYLSGDRLLLISGDKGYSQEQALLNRGYPSLTRHGHCFSLMVNYNAIRQYFLQIGGQFLNIAHRHNSLNICAFLLGSPFKGCVETRLAFTEHIEQLGPDDFFSLKKAIENHYDTLTLPQILAWLRASGWDANIFLGSFPTLIQHLNTASESFQQELYQAIEGIWETYYPIGEQKDLAFHLARLLYKMRYYREASLYLQYSLMLYGANAITLYNLGKCYYRLGQLEQAIEQLDRALEVDPSLEAARSMRIKIGLAEG
ncbi:MAG: tetratricopeptide repeat protein [Symploca sp. SIO2E6]|nr:tetratricopeptide repeat protein [Symploca sp. SIO2E6]